MDRIKANTHRQPRKEFHCKKCIVFHSLQNQTCIHNGIFLKSSKCISRKAWSVMPNTFRLYSPTASSIPARGQMESTSTQRLASEAIAPLMPSSGIKSIAVGLPSSASSVRDDEVRYPDVICAAPRLDAQGVSALGERKLPAPRPVLFGVRSRANDTPRRVGERDRALWIMLRRGERER